MKHFDSHHRVEGPPGCTRRHLAQPQVQIPPLHSYEIRDIREIFNDKASLVADFDELDDFAIVIADRGGNQQCFRLARGCYESLKCLYLSAKLVGPKESRSETPSSMRLSAQSDGDISDGLIPGTFPLNP